MKWLKGILVLLVAIIGFPLLYLLISLLLSYIPAKTVSHSCQADKTLYIHSNGVHLDIVVPVQYLPDKLRDQLIINRSAKFYSFAWGEREFFLHTPEWSDLRLSTAIKAALIPSPSLMHVYAYNNPSSNWQERKVCIMELNCILSYIDRSFVKSNDGKIIPVAEGYSFNDQFYEANGNYHAFYTCNTWVNQALKNCGLPAVVWTPFDFPLLDD